MSLITETVGLEAFCARASRYPFVTVDTEFFRERTYWPVLSLIQIGTPDEARAIDALAEGIDLSPLFGLLDDERVLKVFHAARQDVEIFVHLSGRVPVPIFDTQIAAMVCGYGDSVGYERLVRDLARGSVDKAMQFTDWMKRPLSEKQISYALSDVTHLRTIHEKLFERLEASGRMPWLSEEMRILTNLDTYRIDPESAWKRLKLRTRKPRDLAMARALAAWRETVAQRDDVPRIRILRDETLVDISSAAPRSVSELMSLRRVAHNRIGKLHATEIIGVLDGVRKTDPSLYPSLPPQRDPGRSGEAMTDLLKILLKLKCKRHDVAQKLVASSSDLEALAGGSDVPALHGWRRQVFGNDALRLKRGEIALTARSSEIELLEI